MHDTIYVNTDYFPYFCYKERISSNDESANLTDLTKKRTATWATLQSPPRLQEFADLKSGSRNTSQNGSSHRKCSAHLRTNSISASKCMDVSK